MMNYLNLTYMMISGWLKKYNKILKEFNYSEKSDEKSASLLEDLVKENNQVEKLDRITSYNVCYTKLLRASK